MNRKWLVAMLVVAGVLCAGSASAQPDKEWKSWFGHVAAGYSIPQSDFGNAVDSAFTINGGATYKPSEWPVGIVLDLAWAEYDLKRSVLDENLPDVPESDYINGDAEIWSLTADVIWQPKTGGTVGFYLIGGIDTNYTKLQLTTPSAWTGIICPPYSWYCYPGTIIGDAVIASESSTDFGYNIGAGLTFELNSGSQLFLEAKYHSVDTDFDTATYAPIVFGYRW